MKVYIVAYRGTIYEIFDSREKAEWFLRYKFGDMYDIEVVEREVK
jgi:hypothetical protein